jgi:hypothetical protein
MAEQEDGATGFVRARVTDAALCPPGLAQEVWVRAGSLEGKSASVVGVYEVPEDMPPFALPAYGLEYV